jgi:predicted ArsR family transcriptional regulator
MSDRQPSPNQANRLDAITSLAEPTRRAVYDFVVDAGGWVSRDQAADALDLERGTVAHHLDRLASDGLLEIDYRRLSGRQGPGAGRPAKLYRRARRDFEVSLPPRDYELAGSMLAEAVDRSQNDGVPIGRAIDGVARSEGVRLAEEVRARLEATAGRGRSRRRRAVLAVLEEHGFEPQLASDGTVVLRNCPFHQLAQQHTDLICNMNLCLLHAAIDDVGETGFDARLEPEEGLCCVKLHAVR